jgi:hypothetical protein
MRELVAERGVEKKTRKTKFMSFERDLRIMYMKAVFNCYNELIIEAKSCRSSMNSRSSIGPGELTLALKEYNDQCSKREGEGVMLSARVKIGELLEGKCSMPEVRSHRELQVFQRQMGRLIDRDLSEGEYKWVNYMDEVLEMWQELSLWLTDVLVAEAVLECLEWGLP